MYQVPLAGFCGCGASTPETFRGFPFSFFHFRDCYSEPFYIGGLGMRISPLSASRSWSGGAMSLMVETSLASSVLRWSTVGARWT